MPIELYWDNDEQDVILAEFKGDWTWDDLYRMLTTIKRLSDEADRSFGAIIDLRDGLRLPGGSVFNKEGLENFRKLLNIDTKRGRGPMAVVGMSQGLKNLLKAISAFDASQTKYIFFEETMDEARQVIYNEVKKTQISA